MKQNYDFKIDNIKDLSPEEINLRKKNLDLFYQTGFPNKKDEDWKKVLTPEQFYILRREGTERPFSSILNNEYRNGDYVCIACNTKLFHSSKKYDSGTGWPSFTDAIPGAFITKTDYSHGMTRTAYYCAKCGAHHGHVFNDGPGKSGKRYCSNGICLIFKSK